MSEPRRRIWDWIAVGLILAVVVAHVRFAVMDGRPPQDPNHCLGSLPSVFQLMGSASNVPELLEYVFSRTSSWYSLLLAASMRLVGVSPGVLQAFHVVWVGLLVTMVALVARRLWGPAAAVTALVLVPPNSEAMIVLGRIGWIHIPELALFLGVLLLWIRDPALQRRWTVVGAAALGVAGIVIRPSGLIWAGTLVPLLLSGWLDSEQRRRFVLRCAAVLVCWALALIPVVQELSSYVDNKLVSRDRYAFLASADVLLAGVRADVGVVTGLVALAGIVLLALRFPRRRWRVVALLAAWVVLPFVLYLTLHAGMPNFPAYVAALALLGAGGLARFPRIARGALPVLGVVWLTLYGAQWLPTHTAGHLFARWAPGNLYVDDPLNHYRVDEWMEARIILELIDASCPNMDRRECTIHVDRCLFRPSGVDPGWLEMFLYDLTNVRLVPVWDPNYPVSQVAGDGMGSYICAQAETDWLARFPQTQQRRDEAVQRLHYEEVWSRRMAPGCRYTWYTPHGEVDDLERMPREATSVTRDPSLPLNDW